MLDECYQAPRQNTRNVIFDNEEGLRLGPIGAAPYYVNMYSDGSYGFPKNSRDDADYAASKYVRAPWSPVRVAVVVVRPRAGKATFGS